MGLIATIVVGLVAGLLASWLMKAKTGILVDLIHLPAHHARTGLAQGRGGPASQAGRLFSCGEGMGGLARGRPFACSTLRPPPPNPIRRIRQRTPAPSLQPPMLLWG